MTGRHLLWVSVLLIPMQMNTQQEEGRFRSPGTVQSQQAGRNTCKQFGAEWDLPDYQSYREELQQLLQKTEQTTAWLNIRKQYLTKWTWVNGSQYDTMIDSYDDNCAMMQIQGRQISSFTCFGIHVGFICQTQGCDPSDAICIKSRGKWFLISCSSQNWHNARSLCQQRGGDLAVIPDQEDQKHIFDYLVEKKLYDTCGMLFIGLRKEDWFLSHQTASTQIAYWDTNQPKVGDCAILKRGNDTRDQQIAWESKGCHERHNILCQNYGNVTLNFRDSANRTTENQVTDGNITHDFQDGVTRTTENQASAPIATIITASIIAVLLLALITGPAIYIFKRKQKTWNCRQKTWKTRRSKHAEEALSSAYRERPNEVGMEENVQLLETKLGNAQEVTQDTFLQQNQAKSDDKQTEEAVQLTQYEGLTETQIEEIETEEDASVDESCRGSVFTETKETAQNQSRLTSLELNETVHLPSSPTLLHLDLNQTRSSKTETQETSMISQNQTGPAEIAKGTLCHQKSEDTPSQQDLSNAAHAALMTKLVEHAQDLSQILKLAKEELIQDLKKNDVIPKTVNVSEEERMQSLLTHLKDRDRVYFDKFCECLCNHGYLEKVKKYFDLPENFPVAQLKLKSYIRREFRDLDLYSAEGDRRIPLEKLYVQMEWRRGTDSFGWKTEPLETYLDIFPKISEHGDTRVVISAVPGGGKTSFVKHISTEWVKRHVHAHHSWEEIRTLDDFELLIPIILRLVTKDSSMLDVLHQQISDFTILDAISIQSYISNFTILDAISIQSYIEKRKTTLLVLDGYDELGMSDTIDSLLTEESNKHVIIICTTRPHGVPLLKRLGTDVVQQELTLCGFNNKQIEEYINRFFKLLKEPESKGKGLFIKIQNESNEGIGKMAKVPVLLQMMRIVWNHCGDLGEHIVDLYEKFVDCLLAHMKKKINRTKEKGDLTPAPMINYATLLKQITEIAHSWNQQGLLKNVFFYEDLQSSYPETISQVIQLGFLVKYHPSSLLEKSYWSFTHLSLQEYFVAKCLASNIVQDVLAHFTRRCSSVQRVERLGMVFKFLCGISPVCTNKILKGVIIQLEEEEDCHQMLNFLMDLLPYYKNKHDMDLPLPS